MPRPRKHRRVMGMPQNNRFGPDGYGRENPPPIVKLTVVEYEAIRLIDFENYTQQECSEQMDVARTTVQSIYASARHKIADAIINGKRLVIAGGNYRIDSDMDDMRPRRGRHRRGL